MRREYKASKKSYEKIPGQNKQKYTDQYGIGAMQDDISEMVSEGVQPPDGMIYGIRQCRERPIDIVRQFADRAGLIIGEEPAEIRQGPY